ncbi:unnamed protein product [Closterium sp. NIES-64]|nr:unnamed protein product [Closterium sp. NIES-64]
MAPRITSKSSAKISIAVTCADDIRAGTSTPRPPMLRVPLTKLLGRRGLSETLMLALDTTTTATTPAAATDPPSPATTPTTATTPTAPTASISTSTSPAGTATTLAHPCPPLPLPLLRLQLGADAAPTSSAPR